jgi:hypothetical protein
MGLAKRPHQKGNLEGNPLQGVKGERMIRKANLPPPPIPLRWGGIPPNWNLYFPRYPTMPPETLIVGNSNGGRKLLNYPKYTKN